MSPVLYLHSPGTSIKSSQRLIFLLVILRTGMIPGLISYSLPLMSEHLVSDQVIFALPPLPVWPWPPKNPFRLKSRRPQGFSSSGSASFSWSAAIQGSQTSCLQPKCWKSEESHTGNHFNLYDNLRVSSGIGPVQWPESVRLVCDLIYMIQLKQCIQYPAATFCEKPSTE